MTVIWAFVGGMLCATVVNLALMGLFSRESQLSEDELQ